MVEVAVAEQGAVEVGTPEAFEAVGVGGVTGHGGDDPVAEQEQGSEVKRAAHLKKVDDEGRGGIGQRDPLQYPEYPQVVERFTHQLPIFPFYEGEPVEEQSYQEDEGAAFEDLADRGGLRHFFHFGQYEGDGVTHGEEEKGKDQVGGGAAVPASVFKRREDGTPGTGVIHEDHKGHGGAAEDVEGIESLVHYEAVRKGKYEKIRVVEGAPQ